MMCEYYKLIKTMNLNKLTTICIVITLIFPLLASTPSLQKIIEISPSAFDVMVHAFDQLVVLFHQNYNQAEISQSLLQLQRLKTQINQTFPTDHTLFGYVNMTQDYGKVLEKYSKEPGILILNRFQAPNSFKSLEGLDKIFELYEQKFHPKLPLAYLKNIFNLKKNPYSLAFSFKTTEKLAEYNLIYKRIVHFLEELNLSAFAVPVENNSKQSIQLFFESQSIKQYKYENMTTQEQAAELLQDINIDTLPVVNDLNQNNMQRVFGGSISDQLLLIYKTQGKQHLKNIRKVFEQAAEYNKKQQLAYERALFCQIDSHFYDEQFNQQSNTLFFDENGQKSNFVLMFTKTDYDKFNLKRYIYKGNQQNVSVEDIIGFIEDVRMKRLEPQYKSQKIPTEQQNNGVLRKIVGNSFISEVYQKPDQSIVILFIDSKDQSSYASIKRQLQNFATKHRRTFQNKLIFGIFDLDKNEHKLLYLKQAPQIVLFDKANKKQTKYYRLNRGINEDLLKEWINNEVSNVKIVESIDL